MQYLPVW